MLAEIFMLQMESAIRASEDAAQSKKLRFVPLPVPAFSVSEAAGRLDYTSSLFDSHNGFGP
jgi:hypothetical protein